MKSFVKTLFCLPFLLGPGLFFGQSPEILKIRNPSFSAHNQYFVIPSGWSPHPVFLGQRSIRDLRITRFYREAEKSKHGNTHIALATYANGVRENVGQKLRFPMIPGHTYSMDLWLAWNPSRTTIHPKQADPNPPFNLKPVKIQVYGFASSNDATNSLLAESPVIDHSDWVNHKLRWTCNGRFEYIYLVATCIGDQAYNGNVLMDQVSDIRVLITEGRNKK